VLSFGPFQLFPAQHLCREYLGILAEGLAGLGRYAEAVTTVDRALAAADSGGERWYVAELLRVKGEFLL
jgi:hypothetical protein